MTIPVIRLYTKPGCHLCEQAEELLEVISRECPLAIEQIDIMTDVDLFERYRYEIPVVAVEGGGSIGGRISLEDLRRNLRLRPPATGTERPPTRSPLRPAEASHAQPELMPCAAVPAAV